MRDSLRAEVASYLRAHGASPAGEISLAVRARRFDVDEVLAGGGFRPVERPEGASPRAIYFNVSEPVPQPRSVRSRRADLLLDVLRDGRPHSRSEIWELTEAHFMTNNAAAELRRRGHTVVYDRAADSYRLVRQQEPADVAA